MSPGRVQAAVARAERAGFAHSSVSEVGRLLAVLAAQVVPGGRILELGTGTGVGLAWIVTGLGDRHDVHVTSVDSDAEHTALAAEGVWPGYVSLVVADGVEFLAGQREGFDLVFADAPAGKTTGLGGTIEKLRPKGLLVVDDMGWDDGNAPVRDALLSHPELLSVELAHGSGVILSVKR